MPDQHVPTKRTQPLPLLRNTTYPTYQLYAIAGQGKAPPEKVLAIVVLETLSWLRSRFRELEVPSDLVWPEAFEYDSFDLKSLRSFRIDTGYRVEVVWLPDEQIWALQLTEPDLGSHPGALIQDRLPVPGRLFETNVAFRIFSGQVECGFRTVVSEPEGTMAPCEVYRLAIIKRLARNANVGLKQNWPIIDTPHMLERGADLSHLQEWLKDRERMMLAVIVAESVSDQPVKPSLPTLDEFKTNIRRLPPRGFPFASPTELTPTLNPVSLEKITEGKLRSPAMGLGPPASNGSGDRRAASSPALVPPTMVPSQEPVGQWLIDMDHFAHHKMGYAQVFALPLVKIPEFSRITGREIAPGDVLLIEPLAFGGEVERISRRRILDDPENQWRLLDERIQKAPKDKPMAFGAVQFLPAAKEIEQTNQIRQHVSSKDILRASDERAKAAEQRHQAELQSMNEQQQLLQKQNDRLWDQIESLYQEKAELRDAITEAETQTQRLLDEKDQEIARLHALMDRPKDLAGVIPWAENYLGEGLVFHQRAKKELASVAPGEVDLDLLCDALEYLATDYRDELLGKIDEDECRNRASRKYNRGFIVTPSATKSIEMYKSEYNIKYYPGFLGKPVDSLLDLHLKVGNTNENLLRIYFLYDKEKKQLVIGSLPRHLGTVSYNS